MPQLSIYMDDRLLDRVRTAAKIEGASLSGWARKKLTHALEKTWPQGYFAVFGSLADVDLERPAQPKFEDDVPREPL